MPAEARLLAGAVSASDGSRLPGHLRAFGPMPLGAAGSAAGAAAGGPTPPRLVAELDRAGLVGKGGAGFPTAIKAAAVALAGRGRLSRRPVVVANVMEGEPASRKDRLLATALPHLVLDGAVAMAFATGARAAYVCVAEEHGEAARSLAGALAERAAAGLDPVHLLLERVPSGYVAGEESALAGWLDRRNGRPTYRPDRPSILRVAGHPALVVNAETLAHAALIARRGAGWYRTAGTAHAPGTTLLTVSGALGAPGVREVELGTALSAVLAGAGCVQAPAAVLIGGYGGTWLAPEHLDVALTAAALRAVGASIGAGVVVALAPRACGLTETARIARWMAGESAGQCGPCAWGLPALAGDLADLAAGRDPRAALDRLEFRLAEVDGRGACRHPDLVVRLARSALEVFAADVERHVRTGRPCAGSAAPSVLALPSRRRPPGADVPALTSSALPPGPGPAPVRPAPM